MKFFVGDNELFVNEETMIAAVQLLFDSTMQEPPTVMGVSKLDCHTYFKIRVNQIVEEPVAIAPEEVK
jgi:hypothetical protein